MYPTGKGKLGMQLKGLLTVSCAALSVTVMACDDSKSESADPAEKVASASGAAEKSEPKTAEPPTAAAGGELSHDEVLKQGSSLEGKEVTVKAISWGTVGISGGGKRLNLGPKKLEGLRQAHLVADFAKGDASVDAVKKDAEVKLKCTVGKKAYGARNLDGCKIL